MSFLDWFRPKRTPKPDLEVRGLLEDNLCIVVPHGWGEVTWDDLYNLDDQMQMYFVEHYGRYYAALQENVKPAMIALDDYCQVLNDDGNLSEPRLYALLPLPDLFRNGHWEYTMEHLHYGEEL